MLKQDLKKRMLEAMKAGRAVEKNILRLCLGEIQTAEARLGEALPDEEALRILRKLLKSNQESLAATSDPEKRATLAAENTILEDLLPKTLNPAQIVEALAEVVDQIRAAGGDGQATGLAMKQLRSTGAAVDGKDVAKAVRELRA